MEFALLFAVAAILTTKSGVALVTRRFPHPADLALLSTSYYAVPLAVAAFVSVNYNGLTFLSPEAADPGLALMSMRFAVLGMVALEVGRRLGAALGTPRLLFYAYLSPATTARTGTWIPTLLGLLAIGIYLFGWREFTSGYASNVEGVVQTIGNGLIFSAVELLGLTVMVALLLGQRRGNIPLKPLIAVALAALLFVLAYRAKRLEVVTAVIPAALVLFSSRSWISSPVVRVALGALALLGLVVVSAIRVSDEVNLTSLAFYTMTEGLYAGHALPGIVNRLEAGYIGYEYGVRFVFSVASFVPRVIWETKDDLLREGNAALDGVSPLGATTFLAETVLQGGYVAVAIVFGILGVICERVAKFERTWDATIAAGYLPLRFGGYAIITAIVIPHFRDGIVPAIKLGLQAFLFLLLIVGIHFAGRARVSTAVAAT